MTRESPTARLMTRQAGPLADRIDESHGERPLRLVPQIKSAR
jgi:hypothetical protein